MNCPYTQAQLTEMRADYAALVSGNKARVIVDQNGERVEFTAANAVRLYALIQEAETCLSSGTGIKRANRPMGFFF